MTRNREDRAQVSQGGTQRGGSAPRSPRVPTLLQVTCARGDVCPCPYEELASRMNTLHLGSRWHKSHDLLVLPALAAAPGRGGDRP